MNDCCHHTTKNPVIADPTDRTDRSDKAETPAMAGANAAASLPASEGTATASTRFRIPSMDCSVEETDIRRVLAGVQGIRSLNFQLVARTLTIDAQPDALQAAVLAIGQAGYKMQPFAATQASAAAPAGQGHAPGHEAGHAHAQGHAQEGSDEGGHDHAHDHGAAGLPAVLPRLLAALALAGAAEAIGFLAPATLPWKIAGMAVALLAIFLAGLEVYQKGLAALLKGRLNINALMAVAVTGAFLIGQWPEAAMVMALYSIAELIEALAVDRARNAIRGLMALAPEDAELRQPGGGWATVALADVPLGATVRVRPGGRIPLDGLITAGASAVDQAPVTGESLPVDKSVGDSVFGGTISQTGELTLTVTAAAADSTLSRIIHAVEQAQATRAPMQTFIDRFAARYTPAVFLLALAVALLAPLLLDWTWGEALYKALVLLVIACPCALVVSTPVTIVSGLTTAARRGILIKGGAYLESARRLKAVALDKTGTLTEGRPALAELQLWGGADQALARQIAASLAGRSDHPVSIAIAQGLAQQTQAVRQVPAVPSTRQLEPAPIASDHGPVQDKFWAPLDIDSFEALAGRGVQGRIKGKLYALGNHRLMHERGQSSPALQAALALHETQGRTLTLLAGEQGVLAIFAVADTIRETSRQAVAELKALGVTPVMLSGDNLATATAIARQAGIDEVRAELLPEDKLAAVGQLQRQYGLSGMTGDGINDAPALAQADIGFAMGGAGTDIAIETADVVIMNDDLRRIAETIRLSRRTHAVLWQNIVLALGIKAVFLALAMLGTATMWMAVFADVGASLLVVANGLRLLRCKG
ncbi:MAG: heavy metal translocating P-type ATPase [Polaromonas sp.]|nr:heavy metal translocating P-type ATPase [Polaromonas sp.]